MDRSKGKQSAAYTKQASINEIYGEKEIREAFENVDLDRTGRIRVSEMVVMLKRIGVRLTDDMLEGFAKSINKDKDGVISYEEFRTWWMGLGSERVKGMMKDYIKHKKEKIRKVFQALDADGSGQIEMDEIPKIAARMKMKTSPEELKRQFLSSDLNGDRKISFEEFYHWWKMQQAYMIRVKKQKEGGNYQPSSSQKNTSQPNYKSQGSYKTPANQGGYGNQGHSTNGNQSGHYQAPPTQHYGGYGASVSPGGGQLPLENYFEREIAPYLLPALKQIGMQR